MSDVFGRIGFGCASLTSLPTERSALRLLEEVYDAGVRHFDTAPLYGRGYSEKILGKFLHGRRETLTVTTKFGLGRAQATKAEIERLGFGQVQLSPAITADNPHWLREISDVNHHMGGTRMSATPAEGVVNRDLQVWGVPNLSVASCSVFPTSSHSNPTLTLLALCDRLVQHIGAENSPVSPLAFSTRHHK